MTVAELIRRLQALPSNAVVHIAYDFGDHVHTTVAPMADTVETATVRHSDYHDMDRVIDTDDEEPSDKDRAVVVLR